MNGKTLNYFIPAICVTLSGTPVLAQSIIPANDGTNTQVILNHNQYDIQGGQLSGDGANLFHSFQQFGLNTGQVANFISNPNIDNIFGRVTGGDPSIINGMLQVSGGNSNLYLINPAGILFGANASLNVPADFTATTATGIGFNNNSWFNSLGANNWADLAGNPNSLDFANAQPGAIVNEGNLAVSVGQNLGLFGGTVANTGTLSAPAGNLTLAAVPGENLVRLSAAGNLLSLEMSPNAAGENAGLQPLQLPELLTGGSVQNASQITTNTDGTISLAGSSVQINPQTGDTITSGQLTVEAQGVTPIVGEIPTIQVLGNRVALLGATVDASGTHGGGNIFIGGEFQGGGTLPTASRTFVDSQTSIFANALQQGNGGRVIVWADESTGFFGNVSAQGGVNGGNGGFVEVSGKENLRFDGNVDLSAVNGDFGTLLFDPENIRIVDELTADNDSELDDGEIFSEDGTGEFIISRGKLESLSGNIFLEATNDITIEDLLDNELNLQATSGETVTFTAGGTFSMSPDDTLVTQGGNVEIYGMAGIELGNIATGSGDITLRGDEINLNGSVSGMGSLTIQPETIDRNIVLSGTEDTTTDLDLTATELNQVSDGLIQITIGREDGTGSITAKNPLEFNSSIAFRSMSGDVTLSALTTTGDNVDILTMGAVEVGDITTVGGSVNIGQESQSVETIATGQIDTHHLEPDDYERGGDISLFANDRIYIGGNIVTGSDLGGSVNINGASILAKDIQTTTDYTEGDMSSVILIAQKGNIELSSIETGPGGVSINAFGLFRATGVTKNPVYLDIAFPGYVSELGENRSVIVFLSTLENPSFDIEDLENSKSKIDVENRFDGVPTSIVAYSDSGPTRIIIQERNTAPAMGSESIQVNPGFVVGPDVIGKFSVKDPSELENFDPNNPNSYLSLSRYESYESLEPGSVAFPNNVSGTKGAIFIGQTASNAVLNGYVADIPLFPVPPIVEPPVVVVPEEPPVVVVPEEPPVVVVPEEPPVVVVPEEPPVVVVPEEPPVVVVPEEPPVVVVPEEPPVVVVPEEPPVVVVPEEPLPNLDVTSPIDNVEEQISPVSQLPSPEVSSPEIEDSTSGNNLPTDESISNSSGNSSSSGENFDDGNSSAKLPNDSGNETESTSVGSSSSGGENFDDGNSSAKLPNDSGNETESTSVGSSSSGGGTLSATLEQTPSEGNNSSNSPSPSRTVSPTKPDSSVESPSRSEETVETSEPESPSEPEPSNTEETEVAAANEEEVDVESEEVEKPEETAAEPENPRACTCPGERNRSRSDSKGVSTRDPNCDPHRTRQQRCDSDILHLEFSEEGEDRSIPEQLTGGTLNHATEVETNPNGAIELR
jgi:filamentous hemagglutinin family protein